MFAWVKEIWNWKTPWRRRRERMQAEGARRRQAHIDQRNATADEALRQHHERAEQARQNAMLAHRQVVIEDMKRERMVPRAPLPPPTASVMGLRRDWPVRQHDTASRAGRDDDHLATVTLMQQVNTMPVTGTWDDGAPATVHHVAASADSGACASSDWGDSGGSDSVSCDSGSGGGD